MLNPIGKRGMGPWAVAAREARQGLEGEARVIARVQCTAGVHHCYCTLGRKATQFVSIDVFFCLLFALNINYFFPRDVRAESVCAKRRGGRGSGRSSGDKA